jgi:CheY-like chemotaxis protein
MAAGSSATERPGCAHVSYWERPPGRITIVAHDPAGLGLRVLLVEDDVMMLMMVEDELKSLGCSVVTAANLDEGAKLASTSDLDVALLDVNITGRPVYPVADALRRRGIPFIFTTAYVREHLKPEYQAAPRLNKPFRLHDLKDALRRTAKAFPAH